MTERIIGDTSYRKYGRWFEYRTEVYWPANKRTLNVETRAHPLGVTTSCYVAHQQDKPSWPLTSAPRILTLRTDFTREIARSDVKPTQANVEAQHLNVVDGQLASLIAEVEAFYAARPGKRLTPAEFDALTSETTLAAHKDAHS